MLLNNNYLKTYLLDFRLLNEKNFFFIIENLDNLNKLNLKSFILFKKNKLLFFFKGKFYYFDKKSFFYNLNLMNEFIKIDSIRLNGAIYNNYYLNLNNMNILFILNNFYFLNYNIIYLFSNIILNIIIYICYFLFKLLILIKKRC